MRKALKPIISDLEEVEKILTAVECHFSNVIGKCRSDCTAESKCLDCQDKLAIKGRINNWRAKEG